MEYPQNLELRVYPEYIGNDLDFQTWLLQQCRAIHYVVEEHEVGVTPLHIHVLLMGLYKPVIRLTEFKRRFQQYKKKHCPSIKLRNNSFHVGVVESPSRYIDYLRHEKIGGLKYYSYLRHPFCFDTGYYVGEL